MAYKVYIDGELTNGKWVMLEAIPKGRGNVFLTHAEAVGQAARALKAWKKIAGSKRRTLSGKVHKPYEVRSRIVKVAG